MSEKVYAITDIDGYVSQMRIAAANSISENSDQDDLDQYISLGQMKNLLKEYCLGVDDKDRPLLNEDANEKIYEETAVWIHSVGLAKLAAKDIVECAWDEQSNEMVFWHKETPKNDKPKRKRKRKDSK
jgi:hypothetical protein